MLDEAFHVVSPARPNATYAWKVVEEAKAQMDRVRYLSLPDATPVAHLVTQHQAILDAIAAGRPPPPRQAVQDHLPRS